MRQSSSGLAGLNCGALCSPWVGIGGTTYRLRHHGGWVDKTQINCWVNLERLAMATELMGLVKFWKLVVGVGNCWVLVMLYKIKGRQGLVVLLNPRDQS